MALSTLSKMRRVHSLLAFALCGVVLFALFLSSSSDAGPYTAAFAFGSRWSNSRPVCPHALALAPSAVTDDVYRPVCRNLAAHPDLDGALAVQLCLSSRSVNHGWVQIERTDAAACAASEAIVPSLDPASNALLRAKGPDFFHLDIDGEQRWGAEVDVQYLGRCAYRYPFRLASGASFNLSIWWTFQNYRAALETEDLATQYDLAKPVLADAHQMVYPLTASQSRRGNGVGVGMGTGICPPSVAMSTDPAWRSPAQAAYLASLPECSEWEATDGVYLRAHQTEPYGSIFQGFVFQPAGCRWSNPLRYGAPRIQGLQPRNILFLGDSHTRYAYDLLVYAYRADWTNFTLAPPMKGLIKSERIGPVKLDFVWESVLLEDRITLNCSVARKYDTIVIGGGQHNAFKIPAEADHARQWPLRDWSALTASIARRLSPDACPGMKGPKVVWIGAPARISRRVAAPRNAYGCYLCTGLDAASSFRTRLYDRTAAAHFAAAGGARVDMFALSEPFVNDFGDTLHMRGTDAMTALVQELHQKIAPHRAAYA